MAQHDAPKIGQTALISDLVSPPLTLDIAEVLAHDTEHNAWRVGVCANPRLLYRGVIPSTDATFWVKSQRQPWPHDMAMQWVLYDINSPTEAK